MQNNSPEAAPKLSISFCSSFGSLSWYVCQVNHGQAEAAQFHPTFANEPQSGISVSIKHMCCANCMRQRSLNICKRLCLQFLLLRSCILDMPCNTPQRPSVHQWTSESLVTVGGLHQKSSVCPISPEGFQNPVSKMFHLNIFSGSIELQWGK